MSAAGCVSFFPSHFITDEAKWSTIGSSPEATQPRTLCKNGRPLPTDDVVVDLFHLGVCVMKGSSRGKSFMYQMYISIPRMTSSMMMSKPSSGSSKICLRTS